MNTRKKGQQMHPQFEIKVRNNISGEVKTYFEFEETIEGAIAKALKGCARWNRTLVGIRQVGQC